MRSGKGWAPRPGLAGAAQSRVFLSGAVAGALAAVVASAVWSAAGGRGRLVPGADVAQGVSRVEGLVQRVAALQANHLRLVELQREALAGQGAAAGRVAAAGSGSGRPGAGAGRGGYAPSASQQEHKEQRRDASMAVPADRAFEALGVYELAHLATHAPDDPRVAGELAECRALESAHGIDPLKSWGRAAGDREAQADWHRHRCDLLTKGDVFLQEGAMETAWLARFPSQMEEWLAQRTTEHNGFCRPATGKVVTGVGVGTVSRGVKNPDFQLPLFAHLVPSLVHTADPAYELWLYIVYDAGDAFFDRETSVEAVKGWLERNFVAALRARGVTAQFALLRFENEMRKPGPAFNYGMRALYEDGAQYLVRVNDDSEFHGGGGGGGSGISRPRSWQQAMVETLQGHQPPNFGVAGPTSRNDNQEVFTHDMVHRTHLDVFNGLYYPLTLADWWMDDWITRVYGFPHSKHASRVPDAQIVHHVGAKRYHVDPLNSHLLREEVALGKRIVQQYLRERGHQ